MRWVCQTCDRSPISHSCLCTRQKGNRLPEMLKMLGPYSGWTLGSTETFYCCGPSKVLIRDACPWCLREVTGNSPHMLASQRVPAVSWILQQPHQATSQEDSKRQQAHCCLSLALGGQQTRYSIHPWGRSRGHATYYYSIHRLCSRAGYTPRRQPADSRGSSPRLTQGALHGCFSKLGVPCRGCPYHGVYIRAPDFWKLPNFHRGP